MGSLAIDGLISGLDTTALINSLMQVEAIPQTLLKNKVSGSQAFITALQSLNAKVSSLGELAAKTAKAGALSLSAATTTSPAVTATASTGAAPGELGVTVDALAQGQKSVSQAMTVWPDSPPNLTIIKGDGTQHAITAASTSLDDVVKAINASASGVTATKVAVGGGNFKIQFASTATGADSGFSVHQGAAAGPLLPVTQIQAAQDASVTIWAGTPAAQTVTSKTNTFASLLPGVSISVTAVSATPVTVTVARDDAAISKATAALTTALNEIFAEIVAKSAVATTTDASGSTSTKGGVFTGESTVRDVRQKLLSAASLPVNGRSPSEYGIVITKTGTMEFDAEKFAAALAKDPAATQAAVQTIATRLTDTAKVTSDKYTGTITSTITGQQSEVRQLGIQVDDWDRRLASRRSSLESTYARLEVQLSNLDAQKTYVQSQLAGLSKS